VVPDALRAHLDQAANAGTLMATCSVYDEDGAVQHQEQLGVRIRNEQLIVAFWVKPSPSQTIEIEVTYGASASCPRDQSAVRDARLTVA